MWTTAGDAKESVTKGTIVAVILCGDRGESKPQSLRSPNAFQRGQTDEFQVKN